MFFSGGFEPRFCVHQLRHFFACANASCLITELCSSGAIEPNKFTELCTSAAIVPNKFTELCNLAALEAKTLTVKIW